MKKIFLVILMAITYSVSFAQKIQIHQGPEIQSFPLSEIDSITHDGNKNVTLYYNNLFSVYSVNNVDSISIKEIGYYQVPADYLNGWDDGIVSSDNFYFILKKGDNDNGFVSYLNDKENSSLGLAIYYDNDYHVTEIVSDKGILYLDWTIEKDKVMVYSVDTTGEIMFSDEIELLSNSYNMKQTRKRAGGILSDLGQAVVGLGIVNDWSNRYNTIQNFLAGDWGATINGLGTDLAGGLIGGLIGNVPGAIIGLGIGECFNILNNRLIELGEEGVKMLLGSSQVQISDIKRVGLYTYKITLNISGLDTRPKGERWNNNQVDVKVGVFIRENNSRVTYKYKTSESQLYPINKDGSIDITLNIDKPRGTYYVAPVLIPYSYNRPHTGNIRYGNSRKLEGEVVKITKTEQNKCAYNANSKEYAIEATIDADIISLDEITSWGVEVYSLALDEEKIIYAPDSKRSHSFKFQGLMSASSLDITINGFKLRAVPFAIGRTSNDKVYGEGVDLIIKVDQDIEVSFYDCSFKETTHYDTGTGYICGAIFDVSFRVKGGANISSLKIVPVGNFYSWNGASYSSINDGDYTTTITCQHIYEAGLSGDYYCYIVVKDKNGKEYSSNNIIRLNHDGEHFVSCSLANNNSASNSRATVREQRKKLVHP